MTEPTLLTFPARPVNGGHLKYAPPKIGKWSYEPKYNGWRAILHAPTGVMWNRRGKRLTITSEFSKAVSLLKRTGCEWLDVEILERSHHLGRGTLIVLDLPSEKFPAAWLPYASRMTLLSEYLFQTGIADRLTCSRKPADEAVYIPPIYAEGEQEPVWQRLEEINCEWQCPFYEGLVAKRDDSLYPVQLNSPAQTTAAWVKHRFIK